MLIIETNGLFSKFHLLVHQESLLQIVLVRNCLVWTNCTKKQLLFSIANILGSLNTQISEMRNTHYF